MKYKIHFDENDDFCLIQTDGDFCLTAFKLLVNEMLSHPKWHPGKNCIFDYQKTNLLKTEISVFEEAGKMHATQNDKVGRGKSALVMMDDYGNFGMGRMYQNMTETTVDTNFKIFHNFETAKRWVMS